MHDFIAIGETAVDAFIKLENASVHCDIDKDNCEITLPFATKIPYESVTEVFAVGNAANAAISASRLGLKSALVANVGGDDNGKKCLETLKQEGVDTQFVDIERDKITNYHYVLWYENDRTILQKHSQFEYTLPDIGEPKWIYLTSLGESSLEFHKQISGYIAEHPNTRLAFQPGIFQIKFGVSQLKEIYARTEILFCNVSEAEEILGMNTLGMQELLKRLQALGPKIVVITDGPRGAHAYDGANSIFQAAYPDPKPPFERTGAGDAFASTTVAAIAMGKDLQTALAWGAANSMSVVQEVGAQKGLLTREKLESILNM